MASARCRRYVQRSPRRTARTRDSGGDRSCAAHRRQLQPQHAGNDGLFAVLRKRIAEGIDTREGQDFGGEERGNQVHPLLDTKECRLNIFDYEKVFSFILVTLWS